MNVVTGQLCVELFHLGVILLPLNLSGAYQVIFFTES